MLKAALNDCPMPLFQMWMATDVSHNDQKMNAPWKFSAFLALTIALMQGCSYDVESELYPNLECDSTHVTFSGRIKPLIENQCESCHSGTSPSGGLLLAGHEAISDAALAGSLLARISLEEGNPLLMPPSGALGACDIAAISQWIDDGAPAN